MNSPPSNNTPEVRYDADLIVADGPQCAKQDEEPVYLYEHGEWIGTNRLAVCVAIIVAGQNDVGQWKAGLAHASDGVEDYLDQMIAYLKKRGGVTRNWLGYVIGGSQKGTLENTESNDYTLEEARELLSRSSLPLQLRLIENPRVYDDESGKGDESTGNVKVFEAGGVLHIYHDVPEKAK